MTRLATLCIALLVLCPALAACGGGDDQLSGDEYRAKLAALAGREARTHADAEKAFEAKTVGEIETLISKFADDEQRLGDDVEKLNPPKKAEAANNKLADGAHAVADETRAAVAELPAVQNPKAAIALLNRRLGNSKGSQEVDAALSELEKLGYTTTSG